MTAKRKVATKAKAAAKSKGAVKRKARPNSKAPLKRKRGRPTRYTKRLADEICSQLADGLSLRKVCDQPNMPGKATVFRWLRINNVFRDQYAHAKEESADALFEELLDIVDDARNDWMERHDKDDQGIGWQINGEHIQRSKIRMDARKWMMSKLKPKKYGDRQQHEVNVNTVTTEDYVLKMREGRLTSG